MKNLSWLVKKNLVVCSTCKCSAVIDICQISWWVKRNFNVFTPITFQLLFFFDTCQICVGKEEFSYLCYFNLCQIFRWLEKLFVSLSCHDSRSIRRDTAGKHSLDDVMRLLWDRHGRDFYQGKPQGLPEDGLPALIDPHVRMRAGGARRQQGRRRAQGCKAAAS